MKVTAVIPFFNVAGYIERCARSLLSQTLDDVEFIFVDDCSPDESLSVLKRVISQYPSRNVRVLSHEVNKGLPAARNSGLAQANGEFIYHCDSDDWLEPTMLEKMYNAAKATGSEIVYCDYYLSFSENERLIHNPSYSSPDELLKLGFLSGAAKYNVWNKLVKKSLYVDNAVLFPSGHSMGEDMTMIILASKSKAVAFVPEGLYHYVQTNNGAFTKTSSEANLQDVRFNADRTIECLSGSLGPDENKYLSLFKLNIKLPFLFSKDKRRFLLWKEWYPEADVCVFDNKSLPFRTRFVQWLASKGQFWLVRFYSWVIGRLFYGLFYR